MLTALREDGQPPEEVWQYLAKVPADITMWRPPAIAEPRYRRASARRSASIDELVQLLEKGAPAVVTMTLSDAFYRPNADGLIASTEAPDPKRRHGVIAVGHGRNGASRIVLIRNSWGAAWGLGGYAWISEDYLAPRIFEFVEMREDLTNVSAH
jgi:hypothetical protein